jgi:NUMOD4 motif/HNH endonuclease/AP2 domain
MNNEIEIWKDIPNYEGLYQVSNFGRVKSLPKLKYLGKITYYTKECIINGTLDKDGYRIVSIYSNKSYKKIPIHKLVAITFLNYTKSSNYIVIDHIDNCKDNNNLSNLQIITHRQNSSKDRFGKYTSNYIGVSWHKKTKKWISKIFYNGKLKNLGLYNTEIEAHEAYQKALKIILEKQQF